MKKNKCKTCWTGSDTYRCWDHEIGFHGPRYDQMAPKLPNFCPVGKKETEIVRLTSEIKKLQSENVFSKQRNRRYIGLHRKGGDGYISKGVSWSFQYDVISKNIGLHSTGVLNVKELKQLMHDLNVFQHEIEYFNMCPQGKYDCECENLVNTNHMCGRHTVPF